MLQADGLNCHPLAFWTTIGIARKKTHTKIATLVRLRPFLLPLPSRVPPTNTQPVHHHPTAIPLRPLNIFQTQIRRRPPACARRLNHVGPVEETRRRLSSRPSGNHCLRFRKPWATISQHITHRCRRKQHLQHILLLLLDPPWHRRRHRDHIAWSRLNFRLSTTPHRPHTMLNTDEIRPNTPTHL